MPAHATVPPLPYADASLEEIWACHFLEHLTHDDAKRFIAVIFEQYHPPA